MDSSWDKTLEKKYQMTPEVWEKHANPVSVWSRFSVLPCVAIAFWSRSWVDAWSILPIIASFAWAWFNPRLFARPETTRSWASRAVMGERVWLNRREEHVSSKLRFWAAILIVGSLFGLPPLIWGLWQLELLPVLVGLLTMTVSKLIFLVVMVQIYDEKHHRPPVNPSHRGV